MCVCVGGGGGGGGVGEGGVCRCIIICTCIKCHCTSGADMPQSSMKIVTVRHCTPVHIYMYTEVIIICT